jgi:cyanophycinase-like exopeptidase
VRIAAGFSEVLGSAVGRGAATTVLQRARKVRRMAMILDNMILTAPGLILLKLCRGGRDFEAS